MKPPPTLEEALPTIQWKIVQARAMHMPRFSEFMGRRTYPVPPHPFRSGGIRESALQMVLERQA